MWEEEILIIVIADGYETIPESFLKFAERNEFYEPDKIKDFMNSKFGFLRMN